MKSTVSPLLRLEKGPTRRMMDTLSALAIAGLVGTAALAPASAAETAPDSAPDSASDGGQAVSDPLEPLNRTIYGVNYVVDHVFLRPISYAYRDGVPDGVRSKVTNTLRNLKAPVVLMNDVLQGEWSRAENTSMRFLINTTAGVLGIFDVATGWGYPYHDEDFGQTLAVYGLGDGPYLVLPLFGPSNPRDATGLAVDWFVDPLRMYDATQNPSWAPEAGYVRTGIGAISARAAYLDSIEELEHSSIDTYSSMRSAYRQMRIRQIRNQSGAQSAAGVDGSAFDFDDRAQESALSR